MQPVRDLPLDDPSNRVDLAGGRVHRDAMRAASQARDCARCAFPRSWHVEGGVGCSSFEPKFPTPEARHE